MKPGRGDIARFEVYDPAEGNTIVRNLHYHRALAAARRLAVGLRRDIHLLGSNGVTKFRLDATGDLHLLKAAR